jgi:hypothetical protein
MDVLITCLDIEDPITKVLDVLDPDPNPNPDSPEAWQKIEKWMQNCSHHGKCLPIQYRGLPRRVIDVRSPVPKLCSNLEFEGKYTTLSYCWGGEQKLKLTTQNLSRYAIQLPLEDLPQTIQDSINITRKLEIQYLWIDSLCIVQDDPDEISQEISRMGDIYRNCTLTIVAASARTADEGFLKPRNSGDNLLRLPFFPYGNMDELETPFIKSDIERAVTLSKVQGRNSYFKDNPIESRGWTLQERLFSPRMLIYSTTNLRWLCNSVEDYDGGHPDLLGTHDLSGFSLLRSSANKAQRWHFIVSEFSRRELTNPHDKFPAIAAIAE